MGQQPPPGAEGGGGARGAAPPATHLGEAALALVRVGGQPGRVIHRHGPAAAARLRAAVNKVLIVVNSCRPGGSAPGVAKPPCLTPHAHEPRAVVAVPPCWFLAERSLPVLGRAGAGAWTWQGERCAWLWGRTAGPPCSSTAGPAALTGDPPHPWTPGAGA